MSKTVVAGALIKELQSRRFLLDSLKSVINRTEDELVEMKRNKQQCLDEIGDLEGTLDALAPGWDDDE